MPAAHANDPLLQNWTKPPYNPIVNGSAKDPSAAWETTAGGEWRFSDNVGTIYSTTDWTSWRAVGRNGALAVGDCPSLLPLPKTTPGSGAATPGRRRPTHVHITSGNPYKTWMQAGIMSDGPARTAGSWEPLQPCLVQSPHAMAGCGQCTDAGQTYAAKK